MKQSSGAPARDDIDLVEIWRRFNGPLRAFVHRRVSDPESAEDIIQEVYLKIHTKIAGLRNPSRIDRWIFQIARNSVIDSYRTRGFSSRLDEGTAAVQEDHEERSFKADIKAMVRAMVAQLPPIYRQAVAATDLAGVRQAVAAKRLGISLPGFKSRVQRGRMMLKSLLLACCHFQFDRSGRLVNYEPSCSRCCASAAERPTEGYDCG